MTNSKDHLTNDSNTMDNTRSFLTHYMDKRLMQLLVGNGKLFNTYTK